MKYIVANWKGYPATEAEAVALAHGSDFEGVVVCPPKQFLGVVGGILKNASLGAQDYAPDIFVLGARYVIIGHSDRRIQGDTNEIIAEKIERAVADGLIPILCVGETKEERMAGQTEAVIREQLYIGLSPLEKFKIQNSKFKIIVAYEPVWAISTEVGARAEMPESIDRIICFIKEQLISLKLEIGNSKFLYGGSVTSVNAQLFLEQHNIDGLLVGAASVHIEEIQKICGFVKQMKNSK